MSRLTIYLARLLGLFIIILVGGLLVRGPALIDAAVASAPLMFTYAIISLALGLALVLGHNVWSGDALPVVVTLTGWLILAKGLALLLITQDSLTRLYAGMGYDAHFRLFLAPSFLIGLYLTWAGFTAKRSGA